MRQAPRGMHAVREDLSAPGIEDPSAPGIEGAHSGRISHARNVETPTEAIARAGPAVG
jgi:hypothetical protein